MPGGDGLHPTLRKGWGLVGTSRGFTAVTPRCSGCLGGELWRWLSAYTCGLVCIASILAGTAGILWMREEGRRWLRGGLGCGAVLCGPHSFPLCRVQHGKAILAARTT